MDGGVGFMSFMSRESYERFMRGEYDVRLPCFEPGLIVRMMGQQVYPPAPYFWLGAEAETV